MYVENMIKICFRVLLVISLAVIGSSTSVAAGRKRPHVTRNNNVMILEYDFEEPDSITSIATKTDQLPDTYKLSHGQKPRRKQSYGNQASRRFEVKPVVPTKPDPEIFSMTKFWPVKQHDLGHCSQCQKQLRYLHDSGWQDSAFYADTGLSSSTSYTYTVMARDKSINQNPTLPSAPALSATTLPVPTGPWIGTNKSVYAPNEDIVVYFANATGNSDDWVALFLPTTPSPNYNEFQWMYTDGTQSGTAGIYDGTLNFNGLSAGSYEARFFFNDGYTLEASSDFTVE